MFTGGSGFDDLSKRLPPGGDAAGPRRLFLLFDGTWNRRETTTNVWRFRLLLRQSERQIVYYDEGVGTARGTRILGGALGSGLSRNVLMGYVWLMENYRPGDEIWILGFSRGAFTARSLQGLLSVVGLLRKDSTVTVAKAFRIYQSPGVRHDHPAMLRLRNECSHPVEIMFLGVWDTVGRLGIPIDPLRLLERQDEHTIDLQPIVRHARHALALDEHRRAFEARLLGDPPLAGQTLEERWFVGAHANVGGGYDQDRLCLRPLQWMVSCAEAQGAEFDVASVRLPALLHASPVRDSLWEAFGGVLALCQRGRPHTRPVTLTRGDKETLDYSVLERCALDPSYRPEVLALRLRSAARRKLTTRPTVLASEIADLAADARLRRVNIDGFAS